MGIPRIRICLGEDAHRHRIKFFGYNGELYLESNQLPAKGGLEDSEAGAVYHVIFQSAQVIVPVAQRLLVDVWLIAGKFGKAPDTQRKECFRPQFPVFSHVKPEINVIHIIPRANASFANFRQQPESLKGIYPAICLNIGKTVG